MKLTIEALRGTWRAQHESRTFFDETLEGLFVQLAPGAPDDKLWAAAEVLGGILGAEVVELAPNDDDNDVFGIPVDWLITSDEDEAFTGWQPTEAQQEYFNPGRTATEIEDARE